MTEIERLETARSLANVGAFCLFDYLVSLKLKEFIKKSREKNLLIFDKQMVIAGYRWSKYLAMLEDCNPYVSADDLKEFTDIYGFLYDTNGKADTEENIYSKLFELSRNSINDPVIDLLDLKFDDFNIYELTGIPTYCDTEYLKEMGYLK